MELKVIILSAACIALLTAPVLASQTQLWNTQEQVTYTGLQGAAGTELALKGAAAILAAKGLAALALKAAAIKGVLLAKGVAAAAGVGAALLAQKRIGVPSIQCNPCVNPVQRAQFPTLLDIISGAVAKKAEIVGEVIDATRGRRVLVNEPILYEYITAPRYYPAPVFRHY